MDPLQTTASKNMVISAAKVWVRLSPRKNATKNSSRKVRFPRYFLLLLEMFPINLG
jgi:hypothetical protein